MIKIFIVLMSLVVSTNCCATESDEKENVDNKPIMLAPLKLFADLPPVFNANSALHKYQLQKAHAKLSKAYKTGRNLNRAINTLRYCPDLATKLYTKKRSSLYLVIKNAKRGCGTDPVFCKLGNRNTMLATLTQIIKARGHSIRDVTDLNDLLSIACLYGHRDMAVMLLDEGADLNHLDDQGFHTMHNATLNYGHSTDMIKLLLERGAHLNPVSRDKQTPMNLILKRDDAYFDREETLALLHGLGAKCAGQLLDETSSE